MTVREAMHFVLGCINEADADGYQQFEDTGCEHVPDDFTHDDRKTIHLMFGDETFEVVVKKKRRGR